jgi:hypothetical protein
LAYYSGLSFSVQTYLEFRSMLDLDVSKVSHTSCLLVVFSGGSEPAEKGLVEVVCQLG